MTECSRPARTSKRHARNWPRLDERLSAGRRARHHATDPALRFDSANKYSVRETRTATAADLSQEMTPGDRRLLDSLPPRQRASPVPLCLLLSASRNFRRVVGRFRPLGRRLNSALPRSTCCIFRADADPPRPPPLASAAPAAAAAPPLRRPPTGPVRQVRPAPHWNHGRENSHPAARPQRQRCAWQPAHHLRREKRRKPLLPEL